MKTFYLTPQKIEESTSSAKDYPSSIESRVKCPWFDHHSGGGGEWNPADTSTAVFEARDGNWPGFKCFHATHGEKGLADFLTWAEAQRPGVVDQWCSRTRTWESGQTAVDGRPRILLPGPYRPDGDFATQCGRTLAPKRAWFTKGDRVVEIRRKVFSEKVHHLAFHPLRAIEVCSAIELHLETGKLVQGEEEGSEVFMPVSMGERTASMLINSPQFKTELPRVLRVLGYRIPIVHGDQLVFPHLGFDERFGTYTAPDAPELINMDQRTALMWLREVLGEFCFDGTQSLTHAIARLVTPMCRAIMGWDARGPFWVYIANRERIGKDFLAGLAGILFDGSPNEDAPIEPHNATETRKKITSALMAGRNRMHFANCSGHIQDSALEQAITNKVWSDRVLGSNTDILLPNEIEFSMSGNAGVVTYRGDLAHRARHIRLYFAEEDPNRRQFKNPQLHAWVREHRPEVLSALATLVRHWFDHGQPAGKTPLASFPEWARVVGGVMMARLAQGPESHRR